MSGYSFHRLDGLEPDNLLAFMALLGLLRALEEAQPDWRPRVSWTVDEPPLRPSLRMPRGVDANAITEAAAEGLGVLATHHEFKGIKDLKLTQEYSRQSLRDVAREAQDAPYVADLWAALVSDAAIKTNSKLEEVEPTPLCLMFGQGHQHFLARLAEVPKATSPPDRGARRNRVTVSETDCLSEALFDTWRRLDPTQSFRWDPQEDVRYALRARDPTDAKTKEKTQHGANRLAAIGLSLLTVVPQRRSGEIRLGIVGGDRDAERRFVFRWPIWREPASLAGIRALLGHPGLRRRDALTTLGVVGVRQATRISSGKFMNFTSGQAEHIL